MHFDQWLLVTEMIILLQKIWVRCVIIYQKKAGMEVGRHNGIVL